jgi:L-seryl-tRNA(Ser) seleniumtransferase
MRALRPDKLTLAALAATLALYRDSRAPDSVPVAAMLGASAATLRARADKLAALIGGTAAVEPCMSAVGGGAMPAAELPSFAVTLIGTSADELAAHLRAAPIPVIARIEGGRVWLDVRTIADDELADVAAAVHA